MFVHRRDCVVRVGCARESELRIEVLDCGDGTLVLANQAHLSTNKLLSPNWNLPHLRRLNPAAWNV